LKLDAYFQYIKTNRKAREILIGDNKEFSVSRIIGLALRQDTGLDKAMSGSGKRIVRKSNPDGSEFSNVSKNLYKFEEVNDFFSQRKTPTKDDYQNFDSFEKLRPKKMESYRRKPKFHIRDAALKIDPNDIHWRNTEMLVNFMTPSGLIKHRMNTRLPVLVHKKIRKAIMKARKLALLPDIGFLKPHHRLSLKSLAEDLTMDANMQIDIETGGLQPQQTDSTYDFERDHYTVSLDNHDFYDDDISGDNINNTHVQKMIFTKKSGNQPYMSLISRSLYKFYERN
jgi:ribosomal protein S18